MLFRVINYLHLRYHKSLFVFNARKSLIILSNLWHIHKSLPFAEPQSPHCNYEALFHAGLLKRTSNTSKYSFHGEHVNRITARGLRLLEPLCNAGKSVCHYIFWIAIAALIIFLIGETLGGSYISIKTGMLSIRAVSGILAVVMFAAAVFILIIACKAFRVLEHYQKIMNRQAAKLDHLLAKK